MKKNYFEELLWKSFDEELPPQEKELLQKELERSEELRSVRSEAISLRKLATDAAESSFAPGFADRVLRKLEKQEQPKNAWENFSISLPYSFRRVAYAGIAALLLLVAYNIFEGNNMAVERLLGKENIGIERAYDPALHLYRDMKQ